MAHKSSSTESDHHQIIPSHHPLVSNHQSSHISMHKDNKEKNIALILPAAAAAATMNVVEAKELITTEEEEEEMSERERLKRHRVEVAGRVWIPEIWGQEELLKDWIDCTAFEAPLVPSKITMARKALVQQGSSSSSSTRSANVADLRIHNRDMEFNKHRDLSLANCTNGDVQNTQVFRRQEEHLNKKM